MPFGGVGRKVFRPGNQNALRNRHVLRECARAIHSEDLPPKTEIRVASEAVRTFPTMNQSMRDHPASF
jgi:hypothetical protein